MTQDVGKTQVSDRTSSTVPSFDSFQLKAAIKLKKRLQFLQSTYNLVTFKA